jgi:hypothetical protein
MYNDKLCISGLIEFNYGKRVYGQRNQYKGILICNGTQTLARFFGKKELMARLITLIN